MRIVRLLAAASFAALALAVLPAAQLDTVQAQQQRGSDPLHTLDLTWDRWLDHDEVGERMGRSPNAVQKLYERAKTALWQGCYGTDPQ